MELQASEPSGPESLQSQTRPWPKKRLSISRLGVVHRRLTEFRGFNQTEKAAEARQYPEELRSQWLAEKK